MNYNIGEDPCGYFTWAKEKPSTMSLTVLVMIEMFNAFNALSDEKSLFTTGITCNMYLIYAVILSTGLHLMILYVEFFCNIFGTVALTKNDWIIVIALAAPVIILDEIYMIFARRET